MSSRILCRYCKEVLDLPFLDLGMQPLSNDYLTEEGMKKGQHYLPLRVCLCRNCGLIQISDYEKPEKIFNENYKYFSSYSTSWLKHCEKYVDMIFNRLCLDDKSVVYEVASNDGYLLQFFRKYGIKPTGIDPSISTANIAIEKGIDTIVDFFGTDLAKKLSSRNQKADLIIANNVLAHVPDIGDFVAGLKELLSQDGTITVESPHFLNIVRFNQFDTIYHEHFSYITVNAMQNIFNDYGLRIYDIEEINTHGGSLRMYITHKSNGYKATDRVRQILDKENKYGINDYNSLIKFGDDIRKLKNKILSKLIELKNNGKSVVGYGAAAKGNTLFNYCGIGKEYIDLVVDANPYKQGVLLPGSTIPVYSPKEIERIKPDYILIIPWNIKEEIMKELSYISEWGGRFLTFIPEVELL